MFLWGRIDLSSPKRAHGDWNWPIWQGKYLKINWCKNTVVLAYYGSCRLLVIMSSSCYRWLWDLTDISALFCSFLSYAPWSTVPVAAFTLNHACTFKYPRHSKSTVWKSQSNTENCVSSVSETIELNQRNRTESIRLSWTTFGNWTQSNTNLYKPIQSKPKAIPSKQVFFLCFFSYLFKL